MLKFIVKVILFLVPVGLLFVFPGVVLLMGREYTSAPEVVTMAEEHPEAIFGFSYNGTSFIPYKKLLVERNNATAIALGTSRVMQIRKEFFATSTTFINAGGAGKTLNEMELFIKELPPDSQVRFIILGFDHGMFYRNPQLGDARKESSKFVVVIRTLGAMSRRIYLDYAAHKYTLQDLWDASQKTHHIGLSALLHGDGFRSDGSYEYHQAQINPNLHAYVQNDIKTDITMIHRERHDVSEGEKENLENNIKILERILALCKARNITVVGFIPPRPDAVSAVSATTTGYYHDTVAEISPRLRQLFPLYGDAFFDFTSIGFFGGKDTEFVDAYHGTDVIYARMMLYVAKRVQASVGVFDVQKLEDLLQQTKGDFLPI